MTKPEPLSHEEAVQLRAGGRMFLARAHLEPDEELARENRQVGTAALREAESNLEQPVTEPRKEA